MNAPSRSSRARGAATIGQWLGVVGFAALLYFTLLHFTDNGAAGIQQVPLNFPSKRLTPGWRNPDVRQSTIAVTICVRGWTKTVRPPISYTTYLKKAELRYDRLPGAVGDYELDHFLPLELGGSPFDTRNLWMESHIGSSKSDPLENSLKRKVCAGTLTLKQAQAQIIAYKRSKG